MVNSAILNLTKSLSAIQPEDNVLVKRSPGWGNLWKRNARGVEAGLAQVEDEAQTPGEDSLGRMGKPGTHQCHRVPLLEPRNYTNVSLNMDGGGEGALVAAAAGNRGRRRANRTGLRLGGPKPSGRPSWRCAPTVRARAGGTDLAAVARGAAPGRAHRRPKTYSGDGDHGAADGGVSIDAAAVTAVARGHCGRLPGRCRVRAAHWRRASGTGRASAETSATLPVGRWRARAICHGAGPDCGPDGTRRFSQAIFAGPGRTTLAMSDSLLRSGCRRLRLARPGLSAPRRDGRWMSRSRGGRLGAAR